MAVSNSTQNMRLYIVSQSMTGNLLYHYILNNSEISVVLDNCDAMRLDLDDDRDYSDTILLADASLEGLRNCLSEEIVTKRICSRFLSCVLFNVNKKTDLEIPIVQAGFRGIFYQNETVEKLMDEIPYLAKQGIRMPKNLLFQALHFKDEVIEENKVDFCLSDIKLTSREIEILSVLNRGCTNKEIAGELYISVATVKRHLSNIFQKIDVRSRKSAIDWLKEKKHTYCASPQ